jgi:oxygen-dependent protoporphyrinogen oxidase
VEALESLPGNNGGGGKNGGRRYLIRCSGHEPIEVDAVILAMPTHECSRLLAPFDAALGESLDGIPYSSSVTVSLAYDAGAREALPPGFGFLAPRKENRRMLACTFVHTKFRDRVPEGKALLRCFLGGSRDPEVLNLSDDDLVALARKELQEILNFSRQPSFHRVHRWPRSMAQYVVGHTDRVNKIQARLDNLPGIFLAGNAYSGIGISDCVRTGRAAAQHALGTWAGAGRQGIGDR